MRASTVDIDFTEHREFDAVVDLTELTDVVTAARLLCAELVAGKAEDDETIVFVLLIDSFEAGVLGSETALARGVNDEHNLALVIGEARLFACKICSGKIIDRRAHGYNSA